ncbi:MAG: NAD(P)-binding protein [Gammaproteobacteria bacterium]|nr:NAD(P)-binding protein [Gammaproteobacteria bacterium]
MQVDILMIGAGLSGLTATWQLRLAGVDVALAEARERFGGRVLTLDEGSTDCDMGPSWFWHGQPLIARLLDHFKIRYHDQYVDGAVLFQQHDGRIERIRQASPMVGSLRIQGGVNRLCSDIIAEIDESCILPGHQLIRLESNGDTVMAELVGPCETIRVEANRVVLAIPPRLVAGLVFEPELPAETLQILAAIPTWMAGHAKFFAIYDQPFWRQQGLCGSVISQRGPLAEIHDASPNSDSHYSLFGFSGLDPASRTAMGQTDFEDQALKQLDDLFGDHASRPTGVHFQDWSQEKFTASQLDLEPLTFHPRYGLNLQPGEPWNGQLKIISSETSFGNGGLIEGALEAALDFARAITGLDMPLVDNPND